MILTEKRPQKPSLSAAAGVSPPAARRMFWGSFALVAAALIAALAAGALSVELPRWGADKRPVATDVRPTIGRLVSPG